MVGCQASAWCGEDIPVLRRCNVSLVSALLMVEQSPSAVPRVCWGWAGCCVWMLLVDSGSQIRGDKIALFLKLPLYQAANCAFKKIGLCLK